MKTAMIAAAAAALCVTMPAVAQDADPELENVDWYRVQMIKWKPGKAQRAHEIIEMFEKTDAELGWDGTHDFHMQTGAWDSIVALPIREGIASMGWAENPNQKKWDETFMRQVGGEAQAKAIWEEFDSLILAQEGHIGHIDRD